MKYRALYLQQKIHPVFHVSQLKPYDNDNEETGIPHIMQDESPPDATVINGNLEYEVERILDKRIRYNKLQYLVKWKGYNLKDATWEPNSFLGNAQDLIQE